LILQLSLGMALLGITTLIVDFLMLFIFPSKNYDLLFNFLERQLYAREKFMKTEDFSELEKRKKEEEEEKERKKIMKLRREMQADSVESDED
jgi:hypothetical protein